MAGQARHLLFTHFKVLEQKDLEKCSSLLEKYPPRAGHAQRSRRRPKMAAYVELADRMLREYEADQALEVAADLLRQVDRRDLSDHLLQDAQTYLDQRSREKTEKVNHRRQYLADVKERVRGLEEKAWTGRECFRLKEKYTRLVIVQMPFYHTWGERELMPYEVDHLEGMSKLGASSYSEISALFEPDQHGHNPRIIILRGATGIGKTTTARQLMHDWASGQLYQDRFEYALYVECRDVTPLPGQQTVANLLLQSYLEVFKPENGLTVDPKKLLFILDGFDELRIPVVQLEGEPDKEPPMANKQSYFMRKALFEKSHIIITTRPSGFRELCSHVKVHRLAQILGFSEDDRKEYFNQYFGSETLGANVCDVLQETEILFTMCFVPIVCWMVCTVVEHRMGKGNEVKLASRTLSSVFMSFLANVVNPPSNDSGQPLPTILKRLCALAWEGIYEQKILFEEGDLTKHGLTVSDIQSLFQKTYIFQAVSGSHRVYNFIHKTFQEFLAALFVILKGNDEKTENPLLDVINLLDMSRTYKHTHLKSTVQFLFGLLSKENLSQMENGLKLKIPLELRSDVLLWIKDKFNGGPTEITSDLQGLLYCLYELEDAQLVKSVIGHFQHVDTGSLVSDMDFKILRITLENTSTIEKFHVSNSKMRPEHLQALRPWLLTCSSLRIWSCYLTPSCCADLSSVLSANSSLTELDLGFNEIEDLGASQLCEGLLQPDCKVQKLDLRWCLLTAGCCGDLSSVISTSPSLLELILTDNALGDSGVQRLCEGLKHPDCRLKKLNLCQCSLTASISRDLASALGINRSLVELDLGINQLGDSGVRQLCEGLKHPDCRLQKLAVARCSLTQSCCGDFSSLLSVNQYLTDLDLNENELGDSGVTQLCEGLRHPCCRIQTLGLRGCSLTGSCFANISSVLCTTSSLTGLDLGGNTVSGSAMTQLCEGLRHPACRVRTLTLWMCSLTESCCADLSSVLRASLSLTELELSDNEVGESGMRQLCEGLKHPGCKLQKLGLDDTKLTDGCAPDLCAALTQNQGLQNVSLKWNLLTDLSIPLFVQTAETCAAVRNLKLSGNRFSDSGGAEVKVLTKEYY